MRKFRAKMSTNPNNKSSTNFQFPTEQLKHQSTGKNASRRGSQFKNKDELSNLPNELFHTSGRVGYKRPSVVGAKRNSLVPKEVPAEFTQKESAIPESGLEIFPETPQLMRNTYRKARNPLSTYYYLSDSDSSQDSDSGSIEDVLNDDPLNPNDLNKNRKEKADERNPFKRRSMIESQLNRIICDILASTGVYENLENQQTIQYLNEYKGLIKEETGAIKKRDSTRYSIRKDLKKRKTLAAGGGKTRFSSFSPIEVVVKHQEPKAIDASLEKQSSDSPPDPLTHLHLRGASMSVEKHVDADTFLTARPLLSINQSSYEPNDPVIGIEALRGRKNSGFALNKIKKPEGDDQPEEEPDEESAEKQKKPSKKHMAIRLNQYLPVAFYFSLLYEKHQEAARLLWSDKDLQTMVKGNMSMQILHDPKFVLLLAQVLMKFQERKIFSMLMERIPDWSAMFSNDMLDLFREHSRHNFLELTLKELNNCILHPELHGWNPIHLELHDQNPSRASKGSLREDLLLKVLKVGFGQPESESSALQLLESLKFPVEKQIAMIAQTCDEDRFVSIVTNNLNFKKKLDVRVIIENRLFKALLMFDRFSLVGVLNTSLRADTESSTLFDEICELIKKGERIQSLCNVLTHVNDSYWDLNKLFKFYAAFNEVFRKNPYDKWLIFVHNPLLFFIRLTHFFKTKENELEARSKDITKLCTDMVKFCSSYLEQAGDESLMINILDHDKYGTDFIEYAFLAEEIGLIENQFIENLIYEMWDLGRTCLKSLPSVMRVNMMAVHDPNFSLSMFKTDYSVDNYETDQFRFSFVYISNSVFFRVLSGIIWPLMIFFTELSFSVDMLQSELDGDFIKDYYFTSNPRFWFQVWARSSHLVNMVIKTLAYRDSGWGWLHLKTFYQIILSLYIVQFLIYPIFFLDSFWFLKITQLILVIANLLYVLYYSLAISQIGTILRIFIKMTMITVAYATASTIVLALFAIPLHTGFIQWSQRPDGTPNSELNPFQDYWTGLMTLFEFTFGAVIFNKPFTDFNTYVYSYTFIMIIFSFFGNIMLANLMTAFLANQFANIMGRAKYYTQQMQYSLIKVFHVNELDSIFVLPYVLTLPMLPVFIVMYFKAHLRSSLNSFLHKCVHLMNIFIPTFICMLVYLVMRSLAQYYYYMSAIVKRSLKYKLHIFYLPVWIVLGPFLLLKLIFLDLITTGRILLSFNDKRQDELLNFSLNDWEKNKLIKVFTEIQRTCFQLSDHFKKSKVGLKEFVQEMKNIMRLDKEASLEEYQPEKNQKQLEDIDAMLNGETGRKSDIRSGMGNRFKIRYGVPERKLIPIILKKYAMKEIRSELEHKKEQFVLDISFMLKKFARQINSNNIHRLVSFDREALELSINSINEQGEADMKADLKSLRKTADQLSKDVNFITQQVPNILTAVMEGTLKLKHNSKSMQQ